MKIILLSALLVLTCCTKSETQYQNKENARETVNDRASDTIQTSTEISDTIYHGSDLKNRTTDND